MSQKKKFEEDDGRVIVNMDVDGMRWYDKPISEDRVAATNSKYATTLTKSEARQYTWYALKAGMLIASVFSVTWVLFILFCTQIWFK